MPYNHAMHVLVKFTLVLALASVLSQITLSVLCLVATVIISIAWWVSGMTFFKMLRRVKWLLIILFVIYAFTTPGQYLSMSVKGLLENISLPSSLMSSFLVPSFLVPSYEGITAGFKQALTIVTMLAGLAMLLSTTPTSMLVSGLYQAILPFQRLGLNAQRFAVRMWLTLHYVESNQTNLAKGSRLTMVQSLYQVDNLQALTPQDDKLLSHVTIMLAPLTRLDKLCLIATMMAIVMIWVV